jgi:hypothetical protein
MKSKNVILSKTEQPFNMIYSILLTMRFNTLDEKSLVVCHSERSEESIVLLQNEVNGFFTSFRMTHHTSYYHFQLSIEKNTYLKEQINIDFLRHSHHHQHKKRYYKV